MLKFGYYNSKMKNQDLNEPHAFCLVSVSPIRKEPKDTAEMISQLLFGEVVKVHAIHASWVEISTLLDDYNGFVDVKHLLPISEEDRLNWQTSTKIQRNLLNEINTPWGKQHTSCGSFIGKSSSFHIGRFSFQCLTEEKSAPAETIIKNLVNTPYLWGGKSFFGIDCSGFSQLFCRLQDKYIPRDAYQQAEFGKEVIYGAQQANDLAFFQNKEGKIIHVGIILENNHLIHASGYVRIDQIDEKGIFNKEMNQYTHSLSCIGRW